MNIAFLNLVGIISREVEFKKYGNKPVCEFAVAVNHIESTRKVENYYFCRAWGFELEEKIKKLSMLKGDTVGVFGTLVLQFANGKTYPVLHVRDLFLIRSNAKQLIEAEVDFRKPEDVKLVSTDLSNFGEDNEFIDGKKLEDYSVFGGDENE